VRSAALIAAAMLLTMALAAASGVSSGSACAGTCPTLRCVTIDRVAASACTDDPSRTTVPSSATLGETAPGSVACVSAPAGWRTLDLPPPAR
jgi:hypothetical protein